MNYGKAIRIARAQRGIQQKDLAQATGLDRSYVSLLESGQRTPSSEAIRKIADALRVPAPLFQLLAAEKEDLRLWDQPSIEALSQDLLELVTNDSNEE